MRKIVVIGGGASGMTAAIAAKTENPKAEVRILEHKDITGKKLLSTGNGRCNFTNAFMKGALFAQNLRGQTGGGALSGAWGA